MENRARVVVRYLEWRTNAGGGSHPVLELYAHYGRLIGPVVRALLEDDNGRALQRLIPLPAWGSILGSAMQEHVGRMKSLGYVRYARVICCASTGSCSVTQHWQLSRFDSSSMPGVAKAPDCGISTWFSNVEPRCQRRYAERPLRSQLCR